MMFLFWLFIILKLALHISGMNCIYPSDLLPFTRRPLFLVIDSESSKAFKVSLTNAGLFVVDLLVSMCKFC